MLFSRKDWLTLLPGDAFPLTKPLAFTIVKYAYIVNCLFLLLQTAYTMSDEAIQRRFTKSFTSVSIPHWKDSVVRSWLSDTCHLRSSVICKSWSAGLNATCPLVPREELRIFLNTKKSIPLKSAG